MADMTYIALSAKNLHNLDCSNSGQSWFFATSIGKLQWGLARKKRKYFINNTIYNGADLRIWPIQQKIVSRKMLLLEIYSSAKTLPMTASMLTFSEMAAAAISMSSASSSKAHQFSLPSGKWNGSTYRRS